jgi:magnesium-protoporphyrin O-methyltransferase
MGEPVGDSGCCPGGGGERATVAGRIASSFDEQVGRKVVDPGAIPDLGPISTRLIEFLSDGVEERPSVLDLGCGTGTTALRLAQNGTGPVLGIDLSPASIDIARNRAAVAGLEKDTIRFEIGDAATVVLEPRDWVVLDRVICCYDDMPRLLANALAGTGRRLAFAVPDSRGWRGMVNAVAWRLENLWNRLVRHSHTPGYVHRLEEIDGLLADAGLTKESEGVRGLWYAAVYRREAGASRSVPH